MLAGYGNDMKADLALRHIPAGARVLDIGCGDGFVTTPLFRHGIDVTGIDVDETALASVEAKTIVGSAEALPFADHSFDVVLSFGVLCILDHPDKALAEIARVLKPGGTAIIDIRGARNANTRFWSDYYAKEGVRMSAATLSAAKRNLQRQGFRVVDVHGFSLTRAAYYLPFTRKWTDRINAAMHAGAPDWDYRLSNMWPLKPFAASWYFVAERV